MLLDLHNNDLGIMIMPFLKLLLHGVSPSRTRVNSLERGISVKNASHRYISIVDQLRVF